MLIRSGPEKLPASWMLFYAALAASLLLSMAVTAALVEVAEQRHDLNLLLTVLGMAWYFAVLMLAGYPNRFLQTMTAIFGTDALFTAVYLAAYLAVRTITADELALGFVGLVFYWSIAVHGHIIARAIGRHWFIGIAIAMFGYIMLLLVYRQMNTIT